jgi:hypothetical protein
MKEKTYTDVSIYYHDRLSTKKFNMIKSFVDAFLEKQIDLHDLFGVVNGFINYKNKRRDNFFEVEEKIMGLNELPRVAGVSDPEHLEIFEEFAFEGFKSPGSSRDRAIKIHEAWRKKALELRDKMNTNP